ncbi:MAG: hypothetical protein M3N19_11660 [Candidatus Eremiobacteraeota bacterium]|nr:hypothetical protein [Candidatus Eremiobacteraeota bacterium]
MNNRNPQPRYLWFVAAALFALSAVVAFVHHDAFSSVWLGLAALAVIIGFRSTGNDTERMCSDAGNASVAGENEG